MAAQLRANIYGAPRATFSPGYPNKLQAMQHYMWCLEQQNMAKNPALDQCVNNLLVHWSNQPEEKPLLGSEQVKKKVRTLTEKYWELQNLGFRSEDETFIADRKKVLEPLLDLEKKPATVTPKKRSIHEVRTQ